MGTAGSGTVLRAVCGPGMLRAASSPEMLAAGGTGRGVRCAGCRVRRAGCRVRRAGCRVRRAGCRVRCAGCRVRCAGGTGMRGTACASAWPGPGTRRLCASASRFGWRRRPGRRRGFGVGGAGLQNPQRHAQQCGQRPRDRTAYNGIAKLKCAHGFSPIRARTNLNPVSPLFCIGDFLLYKRYFQILIDVDLPGAQADGLLRCP
jgi:hypothetical protein